MTSIWPSSSSAIDSESGKGEVFSYRKRREVIGSGPTNNPLYGHMDPPRDHQQTGS